MPTFLVRLPMVDDLTKEKWTGLDELGGSRRHHARTSTKADGHQALAQYWISLDSSCRLPRSSRPKTRRQSPRGQRTAPACLGCLLHRASKSCSVFAATPGRAGDATGRRPLFWTEGVRTAVVHRAHQRAAVSAPFALPPKPTRPRPPARPHREAAGRTQGDEMDWTLKSYVQKIEFTSL